MPQILLVEADDAIRETLVFLLQDEGYQTQEAPTLASALCLIEHATYDLILTDLFTHDPNVPFASAVALREQADPTPVAILSAWPASATAPQAADFAFVMSKPFDLDALLTAVAAVLNTTLTREDEQRAQVVRQYFDALSRRDWDALVNLCADDVTYILPGNVSLSVTVEGKSAFRAYTEAVFAHFPAAHFDPVKLYATPTGVAARYQSHWLTSNGEEEQQSGAIVFQFSGLCIQRIGVRLAHSQLQRAVETSSYQLEGAPGDNPGDLPGKPTGHPTRMDTPP
jgi:CheY-like chemotaxis protein